MPATCSSRPFGPSNRLRGKDHDIAATPRDMTGQLGQLSMRACAPLQVVLYCRLVHVESAVRFVAVHDGVRYPAYTRPGRCTG